MLESDTYLAILEEGAIKESRKLILAVGEDRFGPPSEATKAAVEAISDLERLRRLWVPLLHVSSWDELLRQP